MSTTPIFIVFVKQPISGRVKTRLIGRYFSPRQAAEIARAMMRCTVCRLMERGRIVLAVSPDGCGPQLLSELDLTELGTIDQGDRIDHVDQGDGNLGQRLDRVWRTLAGAGPVAFFGIDCPDVPDETIDEIGAALEEHDVAIGPTRDGGYWTLAARAYRPELLRRIDWGTASVYDQTVQRASEASLSVQRLSLWQDVDDPEDVRALRRRLAELTRAGPPTSESRSLVIRPVGHGLSRRVDAGSGERKDPLLWLRACLESIAPDQDG